MSNKETKLQPELFDLSKEQSDRLDLSDLQPSLFDLPETRPAADDFLRPDGKVKGNGRKRNKSNQPVPKEQIKKINNVPSIKENNGEEKITKYTRWINDH